MVIRGRARVDRRTKNLVRRLQPGEIAIISHGGIDKLAAQGLIETRCRLVLNAEKSLSPDYPNEGPLMLLDAGIPIIDALGPAVMEIPEGAEVEVEVTEGAVFLNGALVARGELLVREKVLAGMAAAKERLGEVLVRFVDNTLAYARKEVDLITGAVPVPPLKTRLEGRHALVVVRGFNYKEDLQAIRPYINEMRPVLIGVDGGADALREFGYRPDIVIGDMDSVSDQALREARDVVVHAYPNGEAPGLKKVQELGIPAVTLPLAGTSEDVAVLLAYEKGARLIVAVGTHSNALDFLEKGRRGMGSTFLVRLKVGAILVDAKGVSQLYRSRVKFRYLAQVVAAALLPFAAVAIISPSIRQLLRLILIQFRVLLGL
ncbi:putative cytokinetic ring protein SteA [Thermodesulfitimonas sp.]